MNRTEAIAALRLFSEKAEILSGLHFVKSVKEAGQIFMSAGGGVNKGYPHGEAIDAFILTFRFFIQDKDRISFRQMVTVYETAGIDPTLKARFDSVRGSMNQYLDTKTIEVGGQPYTRRQLMEVFIYGGLAHADEDKKAIYDVWKQDDTIFAMLELDFVSTLLSVLETIEVIRQLNETALQQLGA